MNQIKRVWIPADSFYAEEESCSTRDVQVVLASDYERQVAELRVQLRLANIDQANTQAEVADLTAKLKAKDSALEFAKAAIGDAIYLEEGLDGETGQRVQRLIVEALERGTCDAPGDIADFLTTRERVTQDQITDLTAKLAVSEKDRERLISSNQHWHTRVEQMNNEVEDLTRRLEEAQEDARRVRIERDNTYENLLDIQAKLAAAEQERDTMRTALLALPVVEGEMKIIFHGGSANWTVAGVPITFWCEQHAESYAALLWLAQAMRGGA